VGYFKGGSGTASLTGLNRSTMRCATVGLTAYARASMSPVHDSFHSAKADQHLECVNIERVEILIEQGLMRILG